jgi:hypothetical protein
MGGTIAQPTTGCQVAQRGPDHLTDGPQLQTLMHESWDRSRILEHTQALLGTPSVRPPRKVAAPDASASLKPVQGAHDAGSNHAIPNPQ